MKFCCQSTKAIYANVFLSMCSYRIKCFASAYIFSFRLGSSSSSPAIQAIISSSVKASPKTCATSFSSPFSSMETFLFEACRASSSLSADFDSFPILMITLRRLWMDGLYELVTVRRDYGLLVLTRAYRMHVQARLVRSMRFYRGPFPSRDMRC